MVIYDYCQYKDMRRQLQNKTTTAEGKVLSGRAGGSVSAFAVAAEAVCLLNVQWGLSSPLIHNAEHTGLSPSAHSQLRRAPVKELWPRKGSPALFHRKHFQRPVQTNVVFIQMNVSS